MKILIIDDDKVDRTSLKRDLRNTKLVSEIVEAETAFAGIERFKQESFDCVLLDYNLPDKEGAEVLQELFSIGGELITVITITGTASETLPEKMLEAGAADFLVKNEINTQILERTLRFALKRKQFQEKSEKKLRELTKQLEISNKSLEELAYHDPLTKLLNRRGMEEALGRAVNHVTRSNQELVVILMDLDNFKHINDRFGHTSGDVVLKETAIVLEASLRPIDYVARIGGDEFLLLITVTTFEEAIKVAERVRTATKSIKVESQSNVIEITSSVGVSRVDIETPTLNDLISKSQHALHQSKASGKDTITYTGDEPVLYQTRVDGEKSITEAIRSGQGFTVVKQAIYSLSTEHISGYEFLSRGPKGFFENPDDFFRISQEKNILSLVDRQCFRACVDASKNMDGNLAFHINIFPSTILDLSMPNLLELLPEETVKEAFCIEISEQQIIGDPAYLKKRIKVLRDSGIKIALDDLGFGRSCLESLLFLEPHIIKIDKKRIFGISDDAEKRNMLQKLIKIAEAIEAKVIAEGIENRKDLQTLIDMKIEYGQGFLWGEPA